MKLLALVALVALSFIYVSKDDFLSKSETKKNFPLKTQPNELTLVNLPSAIGSPFSGDGVKMSPREAATFERSYRMHEMGYGTSEEYNKMSEATLKNLADTHDIQALLQLADRAWFSEPVDNSIDRSQQKKDAINYFIRAANGGPAKIPSIVADLTLASEDKIEAAAWNIAASHLKQKVNSEFAISKFKSLTYSELGEAFKRAEYITSSLGQPISAPSEADDTPPQR
jgi:hypothetical protein